MNLQSLDITPLTRDVPKVIDPGTHAIIDYLTAAGLITLGFTAFRHHRRAAAAAFINGGSVLLLSMLTDYPGGVFRKLSFKTHGAMDTLLAGVCAASPAMMGFAGDREAQVFHGQALVEACVIASTDFDSGTARAAA